MSARTALLAFTLATCFALVQAQSTTEDESGVRTKPIGGYFPSTALGVIGALCFGFLAVTQWMHFIQNRKDRAASQLKSSFLSFGLTIAIGLICMAGGFGVRIYNALSKSTGLGSYIGETMFLLLSPCAFLAAAYIVFGHLIRSYDPSIAERCLWVSPKRNLSKWFVWADFISFFLLASGGGMTATASMATMGTNIAMVGLVFQCITFSIFTFLLGVFAWRLSHEFPAAWSSGEPFNVFTNNPFSRRTIHNKRILFDILFLQCLGIMVRCVFRVVEYSQGHDGYLKTTEAYIYLLDFLPLFLCMSLWTLVWPSRALRREAQDDQYGMLTHADYK